MNNNRRKVATFLLLLGTAAACAASEDPVRVVVIEGGKRVLKALKSLTSEHARVYANNDEFIIPMNPSTLGGETRVSTNFEHRDWVSPNSGPVRVRITFHGFPNDLLQNIRVVVKADKQGRRDQDRSDKLKNDDEFDLKYGTSADRAYYLVAREPFSKSLLPPSGAYAKLELLKK